MKKITQNLRWLVTLLTMIVSVGAWAQEVYYEWVETDPSELVTGDVVAIVDKTSGTAMSNDKGTSAAPVAIAVTIKDGEITSAVADNLQWEVTVTDDGFKFGVSETDYLYCTNSNNGVRVGTNENNVFTIYDNAGINFLLNSATSRYVGVYKNNNGEPQDWRCYTSINTNINQCVTAFYKRVETSTPPVTITITISDEKLTNKDVYVGTNAGELIATVKEGDTTIDNPSITWTSSNTSVATISTMGAVTLVAAGTTTITAAYNGSTATYELVVTNSAPVIDYATLPFEFDGGKNDIENTNGLTQEGLGGDYNNSPKMKFDGTGDYLILKFNEQPGKLTFDVKGNTFSGGTFTVQTSEDGETYTDLATYTDTELVGTTVLDEEFNNLGEDVRYIKWIYTEKVGGNVALGNIMLTAYVAPVPYTLTVTPNDNADIFVFYNNAEYTEIESGSEVPAGSEVLVSVSASDGYALESVSVIDADGGEVELTEEEDGISYTFTMPSSDVTVSCTVTEYVQPEGIVFEKVTSTDDLVAGGEYIIVSSSMAMSTTQNNNNRGATEITISENKATINENTQVFTLEGSSDGWYFYTGSGYIYASSKSSNQLKTKTEKEDDAKAVISIDNNGNATITFQREGRNTLMFNNTNNPQIFSCYASDASQQPVQLYKKVVEEENITIGSAGYATYVTKKAIRFNENINAYAVLAIHETSVALDKLTEAPANTPIIVEGAEGEYPCTVIENAERPATNFLKVSTGVTGGANIYALANKDNVVGFYPVASNVTVPAGKAYLEIPPTMSVKGFLALGGLADAINNILVETANGNIFNIAGQKVQNITKGGLYIVNGKKVFVK